MAKYSLINPELLKPGDKILFHTKGFSPVSIGIRFLTKSFWNHAGQYEEEAGGMLTYVIEALGKGVVKTPMDKYLNNKKYILKVVRLRKEAFKDHKEYIKGLATSRRGMYASIGSKYDYWAIVWIGLKYTLKGFFKKTSINLFQNREKFYCSEIICESDYGISSLNPFMYRGTTNQKCDTTTPKDIAKAKTVKFITGEDRI